MILQFEKYQGTGNDFVIIDNRSEVLDKSNKALFNFLCDRRFGIGADGVILLQEHNQYAFEMIYFNADGSESSMCGNGGRCIVQYAKKLGLIKNETVFYAIDGEHKATINDDRSVSLKMLVYENIDKHNNDYIAETGSPHYVKFVEDINTINIIEAAHAIRYNEIFTGNGINVNFVNQSTSNEVLEMRTYERGVEDETLSCGTGTVAVAMIARVHFEAFKNAALININSKGGHLKVHFKKDGVWLQGNAKHVFAGTIDIAHLIS